MENCDRRNHGQKNNNKKSEKKTKKKHWNEIQKPSAWYALGLKTMTKEFTEGISQAVYTESLRHRQVL